MLIFSSYLPQNLDSRVNRQISIVYDMIEHEAIGRRGRRLRTRLDLHELAIYTNGLFVSAVCDIMVVYHA